MQDETTTAEEESWQPASAPAPDALHSLLSRLAQDGQDGVAAYEQLRRRLIAFFRLRFPVRADALADIALDRLARRLHEGTAIDHLAPYALGIARHVALETQAREQRERLAANELASGLAPGTGEDVETDPDPALAALVECLRALGAQASDLILQYYAKDGGAARIAHRQALARALGLTENALRNRALRLRGGLERCVSARLSATLRTDGGP